MTRVPPLYYNTHHVKSVGRGWHSDPYRTGEGTVGGGKPGGALERLHRVRVTSALCFAFLKKQRDNCASCQQAGVVNGQLTTVFICGSELLQGVLTVAFLYASQILKWSSGSWAGAVEGCLNVCFTKWTTYSRRRRDFMLLLALPTFTALSTGGNIPSAEQILPGPTPALTRVS